MFIHNIFNITFSKNFPFQINCYLVIYFFFGKITEYLNNFLKLQQKKIIFFLHFLNVQLLTYVFWTCPFVFDNLVRKKGLDPKEKIKLTISSLFWQSFFRVLFSNEFLAHIGMFGLLNKIKNGSWTSFWCIFFFIKTFLIWCSINLSNFNFRPSFRLKISNVFNSCLSDWWRHKL